MKFKDIGKGRAYNADCLKLFSEMPDGCVDMTLTSPPYDDLRTYNGYCFDFETVAKELFRLTAPGGVVVWVVGDETKNGSETGTSFRQALFFMECGFRLHDTMIYQKDNPPPVGGPKRYYQHFEYMFVFSKGVPNTFNPITAARRNKWEDKRTQRVKTFTRKKDGSFPEKKLVDLTGKVKVGNIFKYVVGVEKVKNHPAIFPEALAEDQISSWTNAGDLVLDPFGGSGTTAVVADRMERRWVTSEISEDYWNLSLERLRP